jgi:hypothetical protein
LIATRVGTGVIALVAVAAAICAAVILLPQLGENEARERADGDAAVASQNADVQENSDLSSEENGGSHDLTQSAQMRPSAPPTDLHETASGHQEETVAERSRAVAREAMAIGVVRLGERVDSYISTGLAEPDADWAPYALNEVNSWFKDNFPDESALIGIECVLDVCYVDIEARTHSVAEALDRAGPVWYESPPPGFLTAGFSTRAGDYLYRVYFFRDTFDVSTL